MSSKSMSKQEEALQFLDDLDSLSPKAPDINVSQQWDLQQPIQARQPKSLLSRRNYTKEQGANPYHYIKRGSAALQSWYTHPEKSTERVKVGTSTQLPASAASSTKGPSPSTSSTNLLSFEKQEGETSAQGYKPSSGWGWGSVWSSASAALQQAKSL